MKSTTQNKSAQVYIFSGEDEYLVTQDARNLVDSLLPADQRTLGLEVIEAQARNAPEAGAALVRCIEAVRTFGFMGARKVVWLKGANFFDRSVVARSNETSELVAQLAGAIAAGLPENNILIVTANAVDRAGAFFKTCSAKGQVNRQEELKPYQKEKLAENFTRDLLRKHKLQASPEAVTEIVAIAGADSRQLSQEVEKLALFVHPARNVTGADVAEIVSAAREGEAFQLADAVGYRDLPRALALLRRLLFQKESLVGLIMALEARFRYLVILRLAAGEEGRQLAELLASDKGRPMHPYFLGKLQEQARGFSLPEVKECMDAILATHLKLVSSSAPDQIMLEKLLVKLCGRKKARNKPLVNDRQ
jgi:DNA polymerase III subunit delta